MTLYSFVGKVVCLLAAVVALLLACRLAFHHPERESVFFQILDGFALAARETSVVDDMIFNMQQMQSLHGKRCLVTGGNRGLGKGISQHLHALGCDVTVATRSVAQHVPLSPSANASLLPLDLASFSSICAATEYASSSPSSSAPAPAQPFDIVVLNAGVAPYTNTPTAQGFEQALGTNCVGNVLLLAGLLERGLLAEQHARVVIVVSETHRVVPPLDLSHLFDHVEYGLSESLEYYARSKLCLVTAAQALARRLAGRAAVHTMCPGPVATDLARDAPPGVRQFVEMLMAATFQTPARAARPVVAIAASEPFAGPSGSHHHLYKLRLPRADTLEESRQDALWARLAAEVKGKQPTCGLQLFERG